MEDKLITKEEIKTAIGKVWNKHDELTDRDFWDLLYSGICQVQYDKDNAPDSSIRAEERRRERELIWSRLELIVSIALNDKDFVRRVCNLITELKPDFLKGEPRAK